MDLQFRNKVALVTGAGSGMGLATAQAFAREGAAVAMVDINEKAVRTAADQLASAGQRAIAIVSDVANEAQVKGNGGPDRLRLRPFGCCIQQCWRTEPCR